MATTDPFLIALREFAGGRAELDGFDVFNVFIRLNPGISAGVLQRERFNTTLKNLVDQSQLRLPLQSSGWDTSVRPALPRWIRLTRARRTDREFDHKTFPWVAELQWLAGQSSLSDPIVWLKLNDFFQQGGARRPLVPVKERSCQILGDEKRLERLLKSRAIMAAGITFESFRCYPVAHVPVHRTFPECPTSAILISENEAGFDSHCRVNRRRSRHRTIVYGKGEEVLKSAEFLIELAREANVTTIEYVGDVDQNGLSMPVRLNARFARLGGALAVVPLLFAYEHLLREVSTPEGTPTPMLGTLPAWLPEPLATKTAVLLARGERRAQELVGWEFLAEFESIPLEEERAR